MSEKHTYDWADLLRALATLAVIVLHTAADFLYRFNSIPPSHWHAANFFDSFTRFCVPVFVMLSGALLLGRPHEIGDFMKRRVLRIIGPLVFWSILYIARSVWQDHALSTADLSSLLRYTGHQLLSGSAFHLWYMYMIIGLYLCIPFLNKWTLQATDREITYFLGICLSGILLAQPLLAPFRPAIDMRFFGGYVGFLVLGYVLAKRPAEALLGRTGIALWIIGSLIAVMGTFWLTRRDGTFHGYFYDYFSPNVILAALGFFLWIRHSPYVAKGRMGFWIHTISTNSYGIYLAHLLVLGLLRAYTPSGYIAHPALSIPLTSVAVLLVSTLLVRLIANLPGGKYISG